MEKTKKYQYCAEEIHMKPYLSVILFVILFTFIVAGCGEASFKLPGGSTAATVRIKSIPLKIVLAAGSAALQVAVEEFAGVEIDTKDILHQVSAEDVTKGVPPTDVPVLMVVNKKTNDILYWKLTDKVKMIRLRHDSPGAIELKVINDTPLRVELWIDGNIEDIEISIEMKE